MLCRALQAWVTSRALRGGPATGRPAHPCCTVTSRGSWLQPYQQLANCSRCVSPVLFAARPQHACWLPPWLEQALLVPPSTWLAQAPVVLTKQMQGALSATVSSAPYVSQPIHAPQHRQVAGNGAAPFPSACALTRPSWLPPMPLLHRCCRSLPLTGWPRLKQCAWQEGWQGRRRRSCA